MVTYLSSLNQKKVSTKEPICLANLSREVYLSGIFLQDIALDQLRKGMLVSVTLMSLLIKKSDTKEFDYMIWECSS